MNKSLFLNQTTLQEQPELMDCWRKVIQQDAQFLSSSYPDFYRWVGTKVTPGLVSGTRTAVIETRDDEVVGLLIVKHSDSEKKLCTLRVRDAFQNKGLGVKLFQKAFDILGTSRPLLSVSDQNLQKFSRIFDYFGFQKQSEYHGLYLPTLTEHSFNGELLSDKKILSRLTPLGRNDYACARFLKPLMGNRFISTGR